MEAAPWKQVNIAYPGGPDERERQAVTHLARVLPAAEADGLITSWFFIRKGRWRVRYLLLEGMRTDPLRPLLIDGVVGTGDIYEPEVHAFGGSGGMDAAHELFHHDSRHLLSALQGGPTHRRERSLILCAALMRAAGLDWGEQGDVWARVAEQRIGPPGGPPDPRTWASFTDDVRRLLLGRACADVITDDWLTAFETTGRTLRKLRESGRLTRGIRAVIALHVIFHWNRLGLTAASQSMLARAAKEAVFGSTPTRLDRRKRQSGAGWRALGSEAVAASAEEDLH